MQCLVRTKHIFWVDCRLTASRQRHSCRQCCRFSVHANMAPSTRTLQTVGSHGARSSCLNLYTQMFERCCLPPAHQLQEVLGGFQLSCNTRDHVRHSRLADHRGKGHWCASLLRSRRLSHAFNLGLSDADRQERGTKFRVQPACVPTTIEHRLL